MCGAGAFDVFVVLKIRTFSWQYESLGGTNAEKRAASDIWQRIYRSNYLDIFKAYVSFLRYYNGLINQELGCLVELS